MASAPVRPPHPRRPVPAAMRLTLAQRRALTAELLDLVVGCSSPVARHRYLVEIAHLNIAVADAIADRYRHPAIDPYELRECTRQALLQAITGFEPGGGSDLMTHVVPLVHQAAKAHIRSRRLASGQQLDDSRSAPGEDTAVDELVRRLDLEEKGAATASVILPARDPEGNQGAVDGRDSGLRLAGLVPRLAPRQRLLLCLELLAERHSHDQ